MDKYILLFIIVLFGCEETSATHGIPHEYDNLDESGYRIIPLFTDESCREEHIEVLESSIRELNQTMGYFVEQPLIENVGLKEANHDSQAENMNILMCHYEEPIWYKEEYKSYFGYARDRMYIHLFLFDIEKPSRVRRLMLHELVHYVGIGEHSPDRNAVMYPILSEAEHYTDSDIELFCNNGLYNCLF